MKILFLSHTYIGSNYVVGSHHLAQKFYEQGHEVYHMSTPITMLHYLFSRDKRRLEISRQYNYELSKQDGVKNLIPFGLVPWKLAKYIFLLTKFKINLTSIVFNKLSSLGDFDYIFIDQPTFYGIEKKIKYKKIIYRPTDIYHLLLDDSVIIDLERKIIDVSDSIICTSYPVKEYILNLTNTKKVTVIENGVNLSKFISGNKELELNRLVYTQKEFNIIYVGAFDKRFNFELILSTARERPNYQFILIGPMPSEWEIKLKEFSNIVVAGAINYDLVPINIRCSDVTILPLSSDGSNNGRSPMKVYEYLACEKIVIAKETTELLRRNEENIYLYRNNQEFISLLDSVYNNKILFKDTDYSIHDWSNKVFQISNFLDFN